MSLVGASYQVAGGGGGGLSHLKTRMGFENLYCVTVTGALDPQLNESVFLQEFMTV